MASLNLFPLSRACASRALSLLHLWSARLDNGGHTPVVRAVSVSTSAFAAGPNSVVAGRWISVALGRYVCESWGRHASLCVGCAGMLSLPAGHHRIDWLDTQAPPRLPRQNLIRPI